jgi:hypothetical protein
MPRSRRMPEPMNLTEYKRRWGIKPFPRKARPREIPDATKHFYPRKPFRPRLDITLEEIKDILIINTADALQIIKEIKSKSYSTEFPFVTVKEFARYTKLKVWQIQQYFITCEIFEGEQIRESFKGRQH